MKTKMLESIPANSNPFHYDAYHMGQALGENVMIMYSEHKVNKYIIVIDMTTGERMRIDFKLS